MDNIKVGDRVRVRWPRDPFGRRTLCGYNHATELAAGGETGNVISLNSKMGDHTVGVMILSSGFGSRGEPLVESFKTDELEPA
jgi:hypothetical protein